MEEIQQTLQGAIEHQLDSLNTAIPAIVVRSDLANMVVDVQPTINFKAYDGTFSERPTIQNVPLQFPCSKTSALTFPVNKGDLVLLVFSQRGIDVWKRSVDGYPVTPSDFRTFDLRDAIAVPGIRPFEMSVNNPSKRTLTHSTNDTVLSHNIGTGKEVEVRLKADGSINITTSNAPVNVFGSNVTVVAQNITWQANSMTVNVPTTTWNGSIVQNGNYTGNGVQTLNGVIFSTHVHGTSPGPSNP